MDNPYSFSIAEDLIKQILKERTPGAVADRRRKDTMDALEMSLKNELKNNTVANTKENMQKTAEAVREAQRLNLQATPGQMGVFEGVSGRHFKEPITQRDVKDFFGPTLSFTKPSAGSARAKKYSATQFNYILNAGAQRDSLDNISNAYTNLANKYKLDMMGPISPQNLNSFYSAVQGDPDFMQFKAETTKNLANYLKIQTGAQRGFPEIHFLKVTQPSVDNKPSVFLRLIAGSFEDAEQNRERLVEALDADGKPVPSSLQEPIINPFENMSGGKNEAKYSSNPLGPIPKGVKKDPLGLGF